MVFSIEIVLSDERGRTGSILLDPNFHDLPDHVKSLCKNLKLGESISICLIDDNVELRLPENL